MRRLRLRCERIRRRMWGGLTAQRPHPTANPLHPSLSSTYETDKLRASWACRLGASPVWQELAASAVVVPVAQSADGPVLAANAQEAHSVDDVPGRAQYASRAVAALPAAVAVAAALDVPPVDSRVRPAAVRVLPRVRLVAPVATVVAGVAPDAPAVAPDGLLVPPVAPDAVALDVPVALRVRLAAQRVGRHVRPAALRYHDRYHADRSALRHARVDHRGRFVPHRDRFR